MNSRGTTLNGRKSREALEQAALAVHWKYGKAHRLIMRLIEAMMRPLIWLLRPDPEPLVDGVQKILVLEQGHLGDVVQLTPFLQNLRREFPSAHIAILGRPGLKKLVEIQNLANELIPIQLPWAQWLPRWRAYNPFSSLVLTFVRDLVRLRSRHFDLAFVSNLGDIRSNFALFLTGARRRVAYGFAGGGALLTDVAQPDLSRMHRSDVSLRLLEQIGIPVIPSETLLPLTRDDVEFGRDFLVRNGIHESDLVVGIHAGAGYAIKEWGEDCFRELANKIVGELGAKVIWFSDPGQPPPSFLGDNNDIVGASLPLRQFLAVLSCCHTFVGNDSGPMHMAAGLGVKVVAIFGPELPEWFGPMGQGHEVVIRKGMWCRPCWRKCRFAEHYCLRLISVEEVMQAVRKIVGRITQRENVAEVTL